jgi:FMN-dependent NADH-azoreductase
VVKDGMQELYPYLETADSVVVSAPVYSMGMPAVPKMMIDRCQPFWAWKYVLGRDIAVPGRPQRRGAFLSCGGTDFATTFDGIRQVMRYFWRVLGIEPAGELLCPGVDGVGEILAQPSAKDAAEDIGRRLAEPRPPAPRANE